jgi:hypothetical protein
LIKFEYILYSFASKLIACDLHHSVSNNDIASMWIICSQQSDRINKFLGLAKLASIFIHNDAPGAAVAAFFVPGFEK